nr:unnamed protein product [Callosobruchus analis]
MDLFHRFVSIKGANIRLLEYVPPSREVCFYKTEWTNDLTLEFLSLFANEPVIWNPRIPDHKSKNKVADAWTNIQKQFSVECSVPELKKKKESLMAMFRQLLNKAKSSLKSGAGRDDISYSSLSGLPTKPWQTFHSSSSLSILN